MPVKIEVSDDRVTWIEDPGPRVAWCFKYARTVMDGGGGEARRVAPRLYDAYEAIDRSAWPFGEMVALLLGDNLWSSSTGPDGPWSLVRTNEDVHAWIQVRPAGETWNGSAWVSEAAPKPAAPIATMCGCGKHTINPAFDRYAQHRRWCEDHDPREFLTPARRATRERARGVGVSAPEPEPLAVQDPTGDDVAKDAYRTTGGRTLDDIIAAHREESPTVYRARSSVSIGLSLEQLAKLAETDRLPPEIADALSAEWK